MICWPPVREKLKSKPACSDSSHSKWLTGTEEGGGKVGNGNSHASSSSWPWLCQICCRWEPSPPVAHTYPILAILAQGGIVRQAKSCRSNKQWIMHKLSWFSQARYTSSVLLLQFPSHGFFFAFWLCNNFAGPENNYFCGFLNLNIILLWSDFLPKTSFSLFANLLNWISLDLLHSWTDFCICPFVFVWLINCLIQMNSVIFFCL